MNLQQRAESLSKQMFLGGPVRLFEFFGRMQLIVLIRSGLWPDSKVLDVGCGCLRGGYWIIHFLNRGCYCGSEPNSDMLKAGIEKILEPDTISDKNHDLTLTLTLTFLSSMSYLISSLPGRYGLMGVSP